MKIRKKASEHSPLRQNLAKGIMFMCFAVILMPVMNALAKTLTVDYPIAMIVWARATGHLISMTLVFWPSRGWRLFKSARPSLQFARSAIMFISHVTYIGALSSVALATASAIMFTAPLLVTALSMPFLGEQVGLRRWTAIIIGFIGALIIIRPGLNTPSFDASSSGLILLIIAAITFAIYQILTRKLSDRDSAETMIVYMPLIATFCMSCVMPFVITLPSVWIDWVLFGLVGIIGGFTQYFVTKSLEQAPASVVSPYLYGELLVAALIGFAVFGDFPDTWTWIGATVIAASGIYIAYREGILRKQSRP